MPSAPGPYTLEGKTGTEVILNGKRYTYFAGTSYFQLHAHPDLIRAANLATLEYGMGSATSRQLTGTTPLQVELEKSAAAFFETEDAVYLPSGYLSSLAGLKALGSLGLFDMVFVDGQAHYSLLEGAAATGKPVITFKNRDVEDLRRKLASYLSGSNRPLIASDGLFPILATMAPVNQYIELAERHKGVVWIDDAHGVGILGASGKGSCEALGVASERLFFGATLSKSFGAYGGIIPGTAEFIQAVRSGSVMTGSSSPMPAAVAAAIKGLEIVSSHPELREHLWENARYLKAGFTALGIPSESNEIPVVSFNPGGPKVMERIHETLLHQGIYIQYTHYQGAEKDGMLRVVVTTGHTREQIDNLIAYLGNAIREATP